MAMNAAEVERLNMLAVMPALDIEEMEQRLESQVIDGFWVEDSLCVWYACTDVCPPGG